MGKMTIPTAWGLERGSMMEPFGLAGLPPLATCLDISPRRECGSLLPRLLSSVFLDPVSPEISDHRGATDRHLITLGMYNI